VKSVKSVVHCLWLRLAALGRMRRYHLPFPRLIQITKSRRETG
jgi:hypothetical protein